MSVYEEARRPTAGEQPFPVERPMWTALSYAC